MGILIGDTSLGDVVAPRITKGLSVILQSLSLHAWVPDTAFAVNFPSWSISVEVMFYLLFPLLLPFLICRKMGHTVLLSLGLWVLTQLAYITLADWTPAMSKDAASDFALRFPLWHLNEFLLGICGALFLARHQTWFKGFRPWASIGASLIALLLICNQPNPVLSFAANGMLTPLFVLLILGLATLPQAPATWLGNKGIRLPGRDQLCDLLATMPGLLHMGIGDGTR